MGSRNRRLRSHECPRHLSILIKSWFALHTPTTTTTGSRWRVNGQENKVGTSKRQKAGRHKSGAKSGAQCGAGSELEASKLWRAKKRLGCIILLSVPHLPTRSSSRNPFFRSRERQFESRLRPRVGRCGNAQQIYMYVCKFMYVCMYLQHVRMYMKAVGNKGVIGDKMSFWTFSQAGRAPTVLFTERKF